MAAGFPVVARETYRIHLNDLGEAEATPVDKDVYDQIRDGEKLARASA